MTPPGSFGHPRLAQRVGNARLKFFGYVHQRRQGGKTRGRIDLKKALDRDARLVETARHGLANRNRPRRIDSLWVTLQRPFSPTQGIFVTLDPDVRIGNSFLKEMRSGIQGVKPHGALEMLDCDVGLLEPDF